MIRICVKLCLFQQSNNYIMVTSDKIFGDNFPFFSSFMMILPLSPDHNLNKYKYIIMNFGRLFKMSNGYVVCLGLFKTFRYPTKISITKMSLFRLCTLLEELCHRSTNYKALHDCLIFS